MVALSIGPITIYWYGIMYLLSFVIGYWFFYLVGKYGRVHHLPQLHKVITKKLDDIALVIILWVIIGGRLGEILFYQLPYYLNNPLKIFYVWEGGMSFVGWFIGVLVGIILFAKKNKLTLSTTFWLFDVITAFLPLWIVAGRFGNFLNQELYWLPVPSDAWGLPEGVVAFLTNTGFFYVYPAVDDLLRVNTNFLSMLFEGALLLLLLMSCFFSRYRKWRMYIWSITALFMVGYALFRFIFDYLRVDAQTQYYLLLTTTQWFSLLFVIIAGVIVSFRSDLQKK